MSGVLVVDDSIFVCNIMEDILTKHDIRVQSVLTGEQALEYAVSVKPDLILLDVILQDGNGYEVCRQLKNNTATAQIPVIFITSMRDKANLQKGFAAGGADYITKPFNAEELFARVNVHIKNKQMTDLLKSINEELAYTNKKLADMYKKKHLWAQRDQLTGLYNRHYLDEILPQWQKEALEGRIFCIVLIDIDNFKIVNDNHGHCAGDYILCCISSLLKLHCGDRDIVIRWGGEEFLIFMLDLDVNASFLSADHIRKEIAAYKFFYEEISIPCTVTMGVTHFDCNISVQKNISRADSALYEGKRKGKNCVVVT